MSWTKIDDAFLGDPKLMEAGPLAELVFVRALVYCNRHLTDGWIPKGALPELCRGLEPLDPGVLEHAPSRLTSVGIFELVAGGYRVRKFGIYQRLKAKVEADRDANARRQRDFQAKLRELSKNQKGRTLTALLTPGKSPRELRKRRSTT